MGKTAATLRSISAGETRSLRQRVLRPHQSIEQLAYAGDEARETLHVGGFAEGTLVGVGSIYSEPMPQTPARTEESKAENAWRIRGMAVDPESRRTGVGRAVLDALVEHSRTQGAELVWCNARASAEPFYFDAGFEVRGEPFELPEIGLHLLMWRSL